MQQINVYVRYSEQNVVLDKVTTLTLDGNLVFKDEDETFRKRSATTFKFALITVASPLIGLARIVRSVAFAGAGDFNRAGREFIGGISVPVVASGCLLGSLLSHPIDLIDRKNMSLNVQMRRTYAYFDAWINGIDLHSTHLTSFSSRVSAPTNFIGEGRGVHKYVWTTAPCMQPVLEEGVSQHRGVLDVERMRRIFPLIPVFNVHKEGNQFVLQSSYTDEHSHIVLFNGACEHSRSSNTCCCCYRVDTAFDRVFCLEIGQGNCTSMANHEDTCGFVFCAVGCVGVCCCTEKNNLVAVNTCLA